MKKQISKESNLSAMKKDKSSGGFQILLIWVLIPILVASAVFLIYAKFTDVNVFDKAKEMTAKLPFAEGQQEEDVESDGLVLEERVVTLQAEIHEKEAQIFNLQKELNVSVGEKEKLLIEQEKLLDEILTLQRERDSSKRNFTEIVSTFEKMSAKSAAPVITKMTDAEAIRILSNLKPDVLASILEKMPAEDAAKYTSLMTK